MYTRFLKLASLACLLASGALASIPSTPGTAAGNDLSVLSLSVSALAESQPMPVLIAEANGNNNNNDNNNERSPICPSGTNSDHGCNEENRDNNNKHDGALNDGSHDDNPPPPDPKA